MKFTKMHGCGNDYIYVNAFEEKPEDPAKIAVRVSDRHYGIGSDGLILICPSEAADFRMEMYNADGSRGQMCGNGIRCVGKYVYDNGLTDKKELTVETPTGVKNLELKTEGGRVKTVRVNMGRPAFNPAAVPAVIPGYVKENILNEQIIIKTAESEIQYNFSAVSMGNPHAVIRVDNVSGLEIEKTGSLLENHEYFPDRANIEFIEIIDDENIKMRVWERGSGETLACGTGACAVCVISFLNGWTKRKVNIHLAGGDLETEYSESGEVYMTGPAETVFTGEINL